MSIATQTPHNHAAHQTPSPKTPPSIQSTPHKGNTHFSQAPHTPGKTERLPAQNIANKQINSIDKDFRQFDEKFKQFDQEFKQFNNAFSNRPIGQDQGTQAPGKTGGHTSHNQGAHNTGDGQSGHNHSAGGVGAGHDFVEHASSLYPNSLAPGQQRYGGYSYLDNNTIVGRSTITGLEPVIHQAISDVYDKNKVADLSRIELESKVANRLTQLNDWENLTAATQARLTNQNGIDFASLSAKEREDGINHLLHSPLPFGAIEQPITKDHSIDLGYTHTLDKSKTIAEDLGNGLYSIKLISNNNNGSHTGHNLGSFNLQLDPGLELDKVKQIGNDLIKNTNNNNKLYLDSAAKDILYSQYYSNNNQTAS